MSDPVAEERLKQMEHALRLADQAPSDEAREACQQLAAAWLQLARHRLEPRSFMPASADAARDVH